MSAIYREQEPPAPSDRLDLLERRLGRPLPADYRRYLTESDGGWLADNTGAVKNIFGVGDVPDSASLWEVLDVYRHRVPAWLLPVADDEYGNLICLSLRDTDLGTVWFWDHEEEAGDGAPAEDNIAVRAGSWEQFLETLRPVDR
ncbi:SMI1/KNR4 family protein [Polymorphospora rubra]|uniref:Knr4/Smi1-like domain-containing protein n=1 Tax=Polymorphospora rubra TaxID=338584 RepID=A0A810N9E9_9ACTN|nr:SMI1/KNR4 family protein [Polymorphospora rubra]BCJ70026.1 hypothetical protein Prubr_70470 [Polymorphospora rubra]